MNWDNLPDLLMAIIMFIGGFLLGRESVHRR